MSMLEPMYSGGNNYCRFNAMYRLYYGALYKKAYSILRDRGWAEDAVQITFMKVLKHINELEDPESMKTRNYLMAAISNNCYSILRKNKNYCLFTKETDDRDVHEQLIITGGQIDYIMWKDIIEEVKKIPEIYSDFLILYEVYHYTSDEIAYFFDMNAATVRKRIQRGRKLLKTVSKKYLYIC